ncbi:hypothetical protein KF840_01290 [bacterium]|nr:hypothetical protein [bacterium]
MRMYIATAMLVSALALGGSPSSGVEADAAAVAAPMSGTLALTARALDDGAGAGAQRLQISAQGVTGTVRVAGVPLQADRLGTVDWHLDGSTLAGTVASPSGGPALASFTGTVTADGMAGTFTTLHGKSGTWAWEGPVPQGAAAAAGAAGGD